MYCWMRSAALLALWHATAACAEPLVSSPGQRSIIPRWSMQSSTQVTQDLASLSQPGTDVSSWYRVGPRGTVMAGLIENGVYNETDPFYSSNMEALSGHAAFRAPWLYREEFTVKPMAGQHYTLRTHGITSKADIYVNGVQIATSEQQQGSYGGHRYDVTRHLTAGTNCILIRAYPTSYLRNFAMGFVDWNPYPADNGTGVWRNVEVLQTGAVSMSSLRVITDFHNPTAKGTDTVNITLKTELHNKATHSVPVTVNGTITDPIGADQVLIGGTFTLRAGERKTVELESTVNGPHIWWPAGWGEQDLYKATVDTMIQDTTLRLSDTSTRQFGIRHVSSSGLHPDMFLRFDLERVETIFQYVLDMGLNTVRLEGKQEHPELYDLADRMGLMVLAGWECCDKWEGWAYNDDADGVKWGDSDYPIARAQMLHEAEMMQSSPSVLGFLVGSDYWPNDRATKVYLDALTEMDWTNPIIASASKRGYPEALGPSGMKMDGPYDWVPPDYWYGDKEGAAFGFGSELGAGVGTPEMDSLRNFMSPGDLETFWSERDAGLYHMSSNSSSFYDRSIYNKALYARYGEPTGLEDYVAKCQMADFEATRAQFEAFSIRQNATRPATGAIYWMLNSAWPNLHWQLFDYYLRPIGAYFGTKVGTRAEHVAYDPATQTVWLINHSISNHGEREVAIDLIDANGKNISSTRLKVITHPTTSKQLQTVPGIQKIKDIAFLRLTLRDTKGKKDLSRNVYWISPRNDVLDWDDSNWYTTPVTQYANYTRLESLAQADVKVTIPDEKPVGNGRPDWHHLKVQLENKSKRPAVFLRVVARNVTTKEEVSPVVWSDNYVTLWPKEKMTLSVLLKGDIRDTGFEISGRNVELRAAQVPVSLTR
ncbi:Glycoside hydrolase family 2 immunoglobulin-like beta-sandwich [Penicillium chermesinum]|nr:Glycoside hydrolase family 2 immunoglobulin-like beta-sandwich [Penicillium chermesinum]